MIKNLFRIFIIASIAWQVQASENPIEIQINNNNEKLGIIFLGDTGSITPDKDKVAKAIENFCTTEKCNMGLLLGDNFYNFGVTDINDPQFKSKFEEPYKNLNFTFYPVLGNHDVRGNWQAQVDYISERWQMPGRFYCLNSRLVNIIALDTNLYTHIWSLQNFMKFREQQAWIHKKLAENNAIWKIVYGHHPMYSNGLHGNTGTLILFVNPMLISNKADFYISGHDHDKELLEKNEVKYIILGTGSQLRPVEKGNDSIFANSSFGFGHLLLTEKFAVLKFVNENGVIEFEKKYIR